MRGMVRSLRSEEYIIDDTCKNTSFMTRMNKLISILSWISINDSSKPLLGTCA